MKILDTNVLIDIDRGGIEEKIQKLEREGKHAISIVTVTELFLGLEKKYERGSPEYQEAEEKLEALVSRFKIIPLRRSVSVTAARIMAELERAGEPLHDLHDIYIAATAITEELTLLTSNTSHFERVEEASIEDWEEY